MSNRRTKGKRRSGHPARVAERQRPPVTSRAASNKRPAAPRAPGPRVRPVPRRRTRAWDLGLGARARKVWIALLEAMLLDSRGRRSRPRVQQPEPRPDGVAPAEAAASGPATMTALGRVDFAWALGTAAAAAGLFATVLSSFEWLGDGPEMVAGVSSLGILHDPGYPSYVLAGHLFTLLIPVGTEAFKVNLFSLVCASLSVAGVQLLARRLGAPRWAAALGALALASSAGFWFYSGFAKHDMFSGLLFLLSLHLLLAWRARPSIGRLVGLAAAIAVGLGSSWPLEVLILPAVAWVLIADRRRLSPAALASALGAGLTLLAGIYGFVLVRASEHPALDWGGASTIPRLIALVRRADFTAHGSTASGVAAAGARGASQAAAGGGGAGGGHAAAFLGNFGGDLTIFARELGVLALLLAVLGLAASLLWRRSAASWPVLLALLANLFGATSVVDFGASGGSVSTDLIDEGFVLGCYFALAVWVAIGAGELMRFVSGRAARAALRMPGSPPRRFLGSSARPLTALLAVALGAAVVVPHVVDNWSTAHRSDRPFADGYAQAAFAELPPHAVLFIMGAELTEPLIYRQVVYHQRRDVALIAADGIEYGWYRQQISRRLGTRLPPATGNTYADDASAIRAVARVRPVYLDPQAAQQLSSLVGYRPVGLLDRFAPGRGPQRVASPQAVQARLVAAERESYFPNHNWTLWPNNYVDQAEFSSAALKLAQAYYQVRDFAGMRSALLDDLMVAPGDPVAERDLAALKASGEGG